MAVTGYYGAPGSGKSYAVISQVAYPAYCAGRRIVTNVDGINPDAFRSLALEDGHEESALGEIVTFDGNEANSSRDFWPHQDRSDAETFVKGGDLIVFDEWALYWPRRGKLPNPDMEAFLRWHRHLTDANGVACDVCIATQVPADVHMDFRALVSKSYKFKKLNALGLGSGYSWWVWDGHTLPKDQHYSQGTHTYKKRYFALYSSYGSGAAGAELKTDKRTTIWTPSLLAIGAAVPLVMAFAAWNAWSFFQGPVTGEAPASGEPVAGSPSPMRADTSPPVSGRYRIVGAFGDPAAPIVVVEGPTGLSQHSNSDFVFLDGRPVRGQVFGEVVTADDWKFPSESPSSNSVVPGHVAPSVSAALAGN